MKSIFRDLLCVIIAAGLAYYLAAPVQDFYCANISQCTGGFFGFDLGILVWIVFLYIFFATILLTVLGGRYKYWWIGISLLPAILFEIAIDPLHIYFPIILGLIAWGLGTMAHKVLQKLYPSFISKIS